MSKKQKKKRGKGKSKERDVIAEPKNPAEKSEFETGVSLDEIVDDTKKKKSKLRMLAAMYFSMYQYWSTKGKNISKMNLDESTMQIEHDRVYTKEGVKCIWTIESTEAYISESFLGELKLNLDSSATQSRTSIILTPAGRFTINFQDKNIINKLNYWERMLILSEEREAQETRAEKIRNTLDADRRKGIRRMFNSFEKFKAFTAKQFKFNKYHIAIEGICPDDETMEMYEMALNGIMATQDIAIRKVTRNVSDYLDAMNITTRSRGKRYKSKLGTVILSDLDVAELDSYSQGMVGDTIGVYAGTDVETSFGVYLNFTASTKAQNILISAMTGAGKSMFIKTLLIFHALCGHRIAIMDYEGKEYYKLVGWLKGVSVGMTLQDSSFINTLKIANVKGLRQRDAVVRYIESVNATERIFNILANIDGDNYNEDDVQLLFSDVIQQLHSSGKHGPVIKEDSSTYWRSECLDYFDMYKVLDDFVTDESFIKKHGNMAKIVHKRLAPYWGRDGIKRYLFEDEIEIDDLLDSKILHFNFGMQSATDDSAPAKEITLKISMMTYAFAKYHGHNLSKGLYTVNLVEEFQRSANSSTLLRTINHWITGGRKGNIVNYIVTNSVASLLDNNNPDATAIKDNFTTYVIGKCRKTTRDNMISAFDLGEYEGVMETVSKDADYENCFLLVFDTGKIRDHVVTIMQVPAKFIKNDYFHTRRVEEYDEHDL